MPNLSKPYHRIWRPLKNFNETDALLPISMKKSPGLTNDYLKDDIFANPKEIKSLINSAHLIIRDIYEIFNYIEPDDCNLNVFSHRLYELLLRICTEFESNCKSILLANGYLKCNDKSTIKDYFKIESAAKLSGYKVKFERWNQNREFIPFNSWVNKDKYEPLKWYQSYNEVKHNRFEKFEKANLSNVMEALAGLISILHAQIGEYMGIITFTGIMSTQISQYKVEEDSLP